jgi:trigger factor
VKLVEEPKLPEVSGDFAKLLGVESGDVDKLKSDIRSNLEREAANRTRAVMRARVMKALLDANNVEIPQSLVNSEIARMKAHDQSQGVRFTAEGSYAERAKKRVALMLIVTEIIRAKGLKADAAKVRSKLEGLAQEYEKPEEFVQWYQGNPERLREIEAMVLEENVVEALLNGAAVTEQPVGFQELLKLETA